MRVRAVLHAYAILVQNSVDRFYFGGFNLDRQTTKFDFPSNFLAIWYIYFKHIHAYKLKSTYYTPSNNPPDCLPQPCYAHN